MSVQSLNYAPDAMKILNGIFCVYKPCGITSMAVRNTLCFNICRDLNKMEQRESAGLVRIKGSVYSKKPFEVEMIPNYADHQLVSGPRYQEQDIRMKWIYLLGRYTSGVLLFAINDGCKHIAASTYKYLLRKYEIKGKFGVATDNFMSHGKVRERSTYTHIKQGSLDRILASIQSSHQSLAYKYSGVGIQSQAAYELASKGLLKPSVDSNTIIYSIKCTEFKLPYFTLEVHCVNETEAFLTELVHDIGIDSRSNAVCTQLRQVQFGHFTLSHALLRKHWTLEHILNNLTLCQAVLSQTENSQQIRTITVQKKKSVIETMQNLVREEQMHESV